LGQVIAIIYLSHNFLPQVKNFTDEVNFTVATPQLHFANGETSP
jgi:hypothetical protein